MSVGGALGCTPSQNGTRRRVFGPKSWQLSGGLDPPVGAPDGSLRTDAFRAAPRGSRTRAGGPAGARPGEGRLSRHPPLTAAAPGFRYSGGWVRAPVAAKVWHRTLPNARTGPHGWTRRGLVRCIAPASLQRGARNSLKCWSAWLAGTSKGSTAGGPWRATLGAFTVGFALSVKGLCGCHPSDLRIAAAFAQVSSIPGSELIVARAPRVARSPGRPGAPPDRCPRPDEGLVGSTVSGGRSSLGAPPLRGKGPRFTSGVCGIASACTDLLKDAAHQSGLVRTRG